MALWLLPALGLTLATLAVATWLRTDRRGMRGRPRVARRGRGRLSVATPTRSPRSTSAGQLACRSADRRIRCSCSPVDAPPTKEGSPHERPHRRDHDVHKRFGRTTALAGLSFDAPAGITGLLGPNGAGKTTLLRMAATVLAPDTGRLRLLGLGSVRVADERLAIRRRLGYMPQEPGFHRSFTAFEFVDYIAILKEMTDRRARHDEVRRVLALVGLEGVMDRKIKALSGGMRRRVALAQALLGDPDLLVLDEPTAGLDPEQRLRFREIVSERAGDRTVLLSTHQTEDVAALCPRVVVMLDGAALFEGTPQELTDVAAGRVWLAAERCPGARLSWRNADGAHRNIGDAPAGAELVAPTLEDGYLLLVGERAFAEDEAA